MGSDTNDGRWEKVSEAGPGHYPQPTVRYLRGGGGGYVQAARSPGSRGRGGGCSVGLRWAFGRSRVGTEGERERERSGGHVRPPARARPSRCLGGRGARLLWPRPGRPTLEAPRPAPSRGHRSPQPGGRRACPCLATRQRRCRRVLPGRPPAGVRGGRAPRAVTATPAAAGLSTQRRPRGR